MSRSSAPAEAGCFQTIQAARSLVLGGSSDRASPVLSAGTAGLVAFRDTHMDSEKEMSWVTRDGSNLT